MRVIYIIAIVSVFLAYIMHKSQAPISTTKPEFSISLSTFNHAELLFTGIMTYKIKNDSFIITNQSSIQPIKHTLLFSKKIESNFIEQILDMRLDTLEDFYFNKCVMVTSGQEYWISIKRDTISKNIRLHHFYHNQVEQMVKNMSKAAPDKYKIEYLSSDTKQDCEY